MKYSEVKKVYSQAWHYYLDPCFDGNDVARLMIEIMQLKARLTQRAVDLAVCTCSTMPTAKTLQIDPECPAHSPNH